MASTNVKNLTEFQAKLKVLPAALKDANLKAEAEIAGRAFRMTVQTTPVKTGRAKGNWKIAFNVPDLEYDPDKFDKGGAVTISEGLSKLLSLTSSVKKIIVCNGVPYVRYLEGGSSMQAPNGMVRRAFFLSKVTAANILRARIRGLKTTLFR